MMGRTLEQHEIKPRERRRQRDGNTGAMSSRLAIPSTIPKDDGYVYRWFNDEKSRLTMALGLDYDFVDESGGEVDPRSDNRHKVHAGTQEGGLPLFSYLMRIRKDWYDESKAAGQTAIDEKMKDMQTKAETDRSKPTGLNIKVS